VRLVAIPLLIACGLLVIALLLPTRRDTSVAAWWARVRYQADFFARLALAGACIAAIVWYVLLPLLGWRSISLTP
jgi:hypothetical protein